MSSVRTSVPTPFPVAGLDDQDVEPVAPTEMRPPEAMTLTDGQFVMIEGPCGACRGQVLYVEQPERLPSIQRAAEIERVRAILAEWDIVELALIRHQHNGQAQTFIALRNTAGAWRDLDHQPLSITLLTFPDSPCTAAQSPRKKS